MALDIEEEDQTKRTYHRFGSKDASKRWSTERCPRRLNQAQLLARPDGSCQLSTDDVPFCAHAHHLALTQTLLTAPTRCLSFPSTA